LKIGGLWWLCPGASPALEVLFSMSLEGAAVAFGKARGLSCRMERRRFGKTC
jgi:hypothetical protein